VISRASLYLPSTFRPGGKLILDPYSDRNASGTTFYYCGK
jgi:hypothetical protein